MHLVQNSYAFCEPSCSCCAANSMFNDVCFLGAWNRMHDWLLSKRYWQNCACILSAFQNLGSNGLFQPQEIVRHVDFHPQVYLWTLGSFFFLLNFTLTSFTNIHLCRLIVTENAQCGLWNQWCTQNKKPRNAKISHSENTPKSDAVNFFLHLLNNEPYSQFNFKQSLYGHFQRLLSTPEKALLLNDGNFATKVNASRRYPSCDIDTAHLFDEEGDPIFVMEVNSPTQPSSGVAFDNSKKGPKTNTGLKRTLCTTVPKKKRPRKTVPVAEPVPPPVDAPPAPQQPATQQPEQQPTNKSSLFKNPSKLALPSKIAFPVNNDDKQFLENFSYLPVSQTKGIALFNAFVNYCNNSEQHAVLVSRAFVSSNIRLHGERVAIRQVQ